MIMMFLLILVLCISLVLSIPSSEVSSSEVDYNSIANMINIISSMNDKERATLLREFIIIIFLLYNIY